MIIFYLFISISRLYSTYLWWVLVWSEKEKGFPFSPTWLCMLLTNFAFLDPGHIQLLGYQLAAAFVFDVVKWWYRKVTPDLGKQRVPTPVHLASALMSSFLLALSLFTVILPQYLALPPSRERMVCILSWALSIWKSRQAQDITKKI